MRVIIDKEVVDAAANAQSVTKLHRLLGFAVEGRNVVIANPIDGFADWLSGLDHATVHICLQQTGVWKNPISTLSLDEAVSLLDHPLGLLVENAANDWHFLRRMMRASERQRLQYAVSRRWVEVLHGGGADLVPRLHDRASTPEGALRTFVLFDSDRRHPDELDSSWTPTLSEACQGFLNEAEAKAKVADRYWRLNRRSIESYLPRAELEIKVSNTQGVPTGAVDVFFRMQPEARWYFNMKKGLNGDRPAENAHR